MSYSTIRFDLTDHVATITLNRPDAANALTLQMAEELHDAAIRCTHDTEVRAVVLTGTGRMFCAGGDLGEFHAHMHEGSAFITKVATSLHLAITRFTHMDAPLIVAVNGTAAGGGFSLALGGDIILTADSARFVSAYTASGLTPDGSCTWFLAKHVGLLRAKELILTNRRLTASEALDWGLVTRVVPADALATEARTLATQLASGPTKAFGGAKRLLTTAYEASLEAQLDKEARSIAAMMQTHDGPHGIASFLHKETPVFEGE